MEAAGHIPYQYLQVHSQLLSYYSLAVTAGCSKELALRSTKATIADTKVPHSR